MEQQVDVFFASIMDITNRLKVEVMQQEPNVEEWGRLLELREQQMKCLTALKEAGMSFSDEQLIQLAKGYEINNELLDMMEEKKRGTQQKMENVQRSKIAMNSYHKSGPYGFGAFIDRKE